MAGESASSISHSDQARPDLEIVILYESILGLQEITFSLTENPLLAEALFKGLELPRSEFGQRKVVAVHALQCIW